MRVQRRFAKQTAVYWGGPEDDGYGGFTFDAPVEIKVRWEENQELFMNKMGQMVKSRAQVYPIQDLVLDGLLYLGTLNDLASGEESDPQSLEDAFAIRGFQKLPTVRGGNYIRTAWL